MTNDVEVCIPSLSSILLAVQGPKEERSRETVDCRLSTKNPDYQLGWAIFRLVHAAIYFMYSENSRAKNCQF